MSKKPGKKHHVGIDVGSSRAYREDGVNVRCPTRLQENPKFVVTNFSGDDGDQESYLQSDEEEETIIESLRKVIHKQAEMIQKLDREILHLREKAHKKPSCHSTDKEDILAYINCKLDLLTEQVLFIAQKVSHERRCRGYCVKHVRTKKCLCRGLEEVHRCCGRIGSICDC